MVFNFPDCRKEISAYFRDELSAYDISRMISAVNSNDDFSGFHGVLIQMLEVHFPIITD